MNPAYFPYILRLAGLELPSDRVIDGRDLWDVMTGAAIESPHQALLFFDDKVVDGARAGSWKYYRHVDRYFWPVPLDKPTTLAGKRVASYTYADPQTGREVRLVADDPMLYDLRLDAGEAYNVVERHPEVAAQVHGYIERWEQDFFTNPRGWK